MKFEIITPDGKTKTRECDDDQHIKVMLKRGWKQVSLPKKSKSSKK
tara:strand:- start:132 stop:269 length:138 start_codon:yes stop_codon:yes gene_type:complete